MKKKHKLLKNILQLLGIILAITVVAAICKVIVFNRDEVSHLTIKNSVLEKPITLEKSIPNLSNTISVSANATTRLNKLAKINIFYNGKNILLKDSIYLQNLRYYLNFEELLKSLNIKFDKTNDNYVVSNCSVNIKDKTFKRNNDIYTFRGQVFNINSSTYICLNDIEHILNLRDHWDNITNKIYLFDDKKNLTQDKSVTKTTGPVGLIRFEDVTASSSSGNNQDLEKFRILGDYLYSQGIKFNITWVPRFLNPKAGVDNNLLTNNTMTNAEFINTLDHLIYRGATIGLHGYTHQHGDTTSTVGTELTSKINTSEEQVKAVVENAFKVANTFNIPIDFFESPHYKATRSQQKILENYFNILYEPVSGYWNLNPMKTSSTLYVPTPLGYVTDEHGEKLAKKIRKDYKFILTSVFIHPFKELKFINVKPIDSNGCFDYNYQDNTPVKNIVKALQDTNHVTISVKDLLKK